MKAGRNENEIPLQGYFVSFPPYASARKTKCVSFPFSFLSFPQLEIERWPSWPPELRPPVPSWPLVPRVNFRQPGRLARFALVREA